MMRFIEKFGWRKLLKFGKILIINELWIAFKDTNSLILAYTSHRTEQLLCEDVYLMGHSIAALFSIIPFWERIIFFFFGLQLSWGKQDQTYISLNLTYILMNGLLFLLSSSHPIHAFHLDPRKRKEEIFHQTSFIKLFSWNNSSKRLQQLYPLHKPNWNIQFSIQQQ